jgi:hypothetical protein
MIRRVLEAEEGHGRAHDAGGGRVFISYRRQETGPYARLLYEELSRRLGSEQVFMDVDSIEVGVDFAEAIQGAVAACEVLLALVGPEVADHRRCEWAAAPGGSR